MRLTKAFQDTSFGTWALRVFLGVMLLLTGILNISGVLLTSEAFTALGFGSAVRIIVGVLELVIAILMFVPGMALVAGASLAVLSAVALVLRTIHSEMPMALLSAFWLAMAVLVIVGAIREKPRRPDDPLFA